VAQPAIEAVTVDFYDTLVFHRDGRGRGAAVVAYLESQGLEHGPWEHSVLYEVFEEHEGRYSPSAPPGVRAEYHAHVARRLFDRLEVPATKTELAGHVSALWEILGPASFGVFADVRDGLGALKSAGYRIALVSNWQSGVRHFCDELGLLPLVDHVVGSADVGFAKPDPRIFHEAARRLAVSPTRILHVGDSLTDDYRGAEAAGLVPVHLVRDPKAETEATRVVRGLTELPSVLRRVG
jgi:HAD superfamily hydrolase (TIGR01549 family)